MFFDRGLETVQVDLCSGQNCKGDGWRSVGLVIRAVTFLPSVLQDFNQEEEGTLLPSSKCVRQKYRYLICLEIHLSCYCTCTVMLVRILVFVYLISINQNSALFQKYTHLNIEANLADCFIVLSKNASTSFL